MNIYEDIERLIQYGLSQQLIHEEDVVYTRNRILEILRLEDWEQVDVTGEEVPNQPSDILERILDWAAAQGLLQENTVTFRDLLDTKIMAAFVKRPSEVIRDFKDLYEQEGPKAATENFYQMSKASHYIRQDRIAKNEHWTVGTEYGDIEITINLSKPEKDPKAIAAAKSVKQTNYPSCLLCKENVGFAGRVNHPARQNHRTIPVTLNEELWHIQFSPYVYYNEHAIVFYDKHEPMKISKRTFDHLLAFTEKFPHYFLGSNADLPIVGGSILSHDHFQGGHHDFPMAIADIERQFTIASYPDVNVGIVKWPMSVVRLQGKDREQVSELAEHILQSWKEYSDPNVDVYAFTDDIPHNTITPIARRRGDLFELDLVLRNNRTSEEHPMGIFHPHEEVHHIKKENIGLIEVMGLAVLPGRLQDELKRLANYLVQPNWEDQVQQDEEVVKHLEWAKSLAAKHEERSPQSMEAILQEEVGHIFATILEHAGVFKRNEEGQQAFRQFLRQLGGTEKG
ncbi:UDP-glucose--hexose-1-phosphate uridylyltransferase [Salirhabdus salicampi]|uniref:UDP-glucose--hexose-1-phosphate uridylyltransferase n=1 Tax=Salirhabdus salicampi TaxID=476102 RepID=UPI0020C4B4C8|nr:UDP-glucose--hexose-1-phosphate uridylyltransferase [Salirhabdus salicampi]MCP8617553.1 UDP-glucose--hexose-1-phosphate uridylyltransferase [Salirhabdus salicampi]